MNRLRVIDSATGRFAWKEFRQLRPIAIAFAITAVMVSLMMSVLISQPSLGFGEFLASVWLALFSVLCGSILFAGENEHSTIRNLQFLPVSWRSVYFGKILGAMSMAALAVAITVALAMLGTAGFTAFRVSWSTTLIAGTGALMYFALGVIFSVLCRRVLVAAVLAIASGSIVDAMLVRLTSDYSTDFLSLEAYADIGGLRLVLAFVFLMASIPLSRRWWLGSSAESRRRKAVSIAGIRGRQTNSGSWNSSFSRLLWQTAHQNLVPLVVVASLVLIPCLLLSLVIPGNGRFDTPAVDGFAVLLMMFACYLAGVFCFAGDQRRNSFRFFSQHKEHPRLVWMSRNAFWLVSLIMICGIGMVLVRLNVGFERSRWSVGGILLFPHVFSMALSGDDLQSILARAGQYNAFLIAGGLLIFSVSQLASMFCRSNIFASFAAGILSSLAVVWTLLAILTGAPWWWSVLPLAMLTLIATWWWSPSWIVEKPSWQGWLPAGGLLSGGFIATAVGINLFMGGLIPDIRTNTVWSSEDSSILSQESRQRYGLALASFESDTRLEGDWLDHRYSQWLPRPESVMREARDWVQRNSLTLTHLHQAADYLNDRLPHLEGIRPYGDTVIDVGRPLCPLESIIYWGGLSKLLQAQAEILVESGDSQNAWRAIETQIKIQKQAQWFYPNHYDRWITIQQANQWSDLPGLTEDSLRRAITVLESASFDIWDARRRELHWEFEGTRYASNPFYGSQLYSLVTVFQAIIPADRNRWNRLRKHMLTLSLRQIDKMEAQANKGKLTGFRPGESVGSLIPDHQFPTLLDWSTHSLNLSEASMFVKFNSSQWRIRSLIENARARNALKTKLAICIFRERKGHLPRTLDELVAEKIIEKVPVDPVTQKPLAWLPRGVSKPVYANVTGSHHLPSIPENHAILFASSVANLAESEVQVIPTSLLTKLDEIDPRMIPAETKRGFTRFLFGPTRLELSQHHFAISGQPAAQQKE